MRLAMGIPVGSEIEFAKEVTRWKAMEGQREMWPPSDARC
jgi:recombinational DNA repair protein RecR